MNNDAMKFVLGVLLSALFFSNNFVLFILTYVFVFVGMAAHTLTGKSSVKSKIVSTVVYAAVMIFQIVYNVQVTFAEGSGGFASILNRFTGALLAVIPFVIHRMFFGRKSAKYDLPSVQDITVFTFNEVVENIANVKDMIDKGKQSLSKENINELVNDIPRHNSFRYINRGSLTDEYFEIANQSLDDPRLYIIISNTGSPASEFISLFTGKRFNHASLSFDRELKTIVSYNGGERLYPPGLNMEMLRYFNKKPDSSIIVYSIAASREQKWTILEKIQSINRQGNAYNLLGLVFKFSYRPNIMFCSQFVYRMLKIAGLHYFDQKDGRIKPADLVEQDYRRQLKYEYEINFLDINHACR